LLEIRRGAGQPTGLGAEHEIRVHAPGGRVHRRDQFVPERAQALVGPQHPQERPDQGVMRQVLEQIGARRDRPIVRARHPGDLLGRQMRLEPTPDLVPGRRLLTGKRLELGPLLGVLQLPPTNRRAMERRVEGAAGQPHAGDCRNRRVLHLKAAALLPA
jgi:hypothetical protein